jgi:hypothetical protein
MSIYRTRVGFRLLGIGDGLAEEAVNPSVPAPIPWASAESLSAIGRSRRNPVSVRKV